MTGISAIRLIGNHSARCGTYVLWIHVRADRTLAFGRFKGGKLIAVPAGNYVYVGSAMGTQGASSLARRLVRHATRSGEKPPHAIRGPLLARFAAAGLGTGNLLPKTPKTLFWNVDFLLDESAVEIEGVIAIRSAGRLESRIAHLLDADSATAVIEAGLGANDSPGSTHLLRVNVGEWWWNDLPTSIQSFLT